MIDDKHTQGSWVAIGVPSFMTIARADYPEEIAVLRRNEESDIGDDERVANAHLIAAAPDMADALRAILFQVIQGKVLERDACITQAREALFKAGTLVRPT